MTQQPATQRTTAWANAHDVASAHDAEVIELHQGILLELASTSTSPCAPPCMQSPNEVGTWSLEYLGPGFHVQLRIARRNRQARLDGWMSPAQPIKVFLSSLLHKPTVLEAQVSDTGRFEFPIAPTGACRMSFADRGPRSAPGDPAVLDLTACMMPTVWTQGGRRSPVRPPVKYWSATFRSH